MISVNFLKNFRKIPSARLLNRQGGLPPMDIRERTQSDFTSYLKSVQGFWPLLFPDWRPPSVGNAMRLFSNRAEGKAGWIYYFNRS